MSSETQQQVLEDKLARRKRIFNDTAIEVASAEPEAISKLIRQTVEDIESLRERESALRRTFADKIATLNDERLAQLRTYVPIPPSAYKDDAQERRTRPSKDKDASQPDTTTVIKPRAKSVSAEDKNALAIMKALGMDSLEEAKAWLAAKKATIAKPVLEPQPAQGIESEEPTQEDLDKEAEEDEIKLPE